MKKIIVSILGEDRPGIVYAVTRVLCEEGCNVLEASQTILQSEFAGIFLASMPDDLTRERLQQSLEEGLASLGCSVWLKDFKAGAYSAPGAEPYVITLRGRDRLGIIPGVAGVIAGFDVNIENLRAITIKDDPSQVVIVFEVAVPKGVHRPAFREALKWKAEEFGMDLGVQHRDIFEAVHRL
ncbi:MAG: ACT domain-containing protein [Thermodesulfobacteriota bacterium]